MHQQPVVAQTENQDQDDEEDNSNNNDEEVQPQNIVINKQAVVIPIKPLANDKPKFTYIDDCDKWKCD